MSKLLLYHRHHDISVYDDILNYTVTLNFTDNYRKLLQRQLYAGYMFSSVAVITTAMRDEILFKIETIEKLPNIKYQRFSDISSFADCPIETSLGEIIGAQYNWFANNTITVPMMHRLVREMNDVKDCNFHQNGIYGVNLYHYFLQAMQYHFSKYPTDQISDNSCLYFLYKLTLPESQRANASTTFYKTDFNSYYQLAHFLNKTGSQLISNSNCDTVMLYTNRRKRETMTMYGITFEKPVDKYANYNYSIPSLLYIVHYSDSRALRERAKHHLRRLNYTLPLNRKRRWDADLVCGWPLASASAKILGGECSVSPVVDDIRSSLQTTQRIITEQSSQIDLLFKDVLLQNEHLNNVYQLLSNMHADFRVLSERYDLVFEITRYWNSFTHHILSYIQGYQSVLVHFNALRLGSSNSYSLQMDSLLKLNEILQVYNATISFASSDSIILSDMSFTNAFDGVSDLSAMISVPIHYGTPTYGLFSAYTFPICYNFNNTYYTSSQHNIEFVLCARNFNCRSFNPSMCYTSTIGQLVCPKSFVFESYTPKLIKATNESCQQSFLIPQHTIFIGKAVTFNTFHCSNNTFNASFNTHGPLLMDMQCGYVYNIVGDKSYHHCLCSKGETYYYTFDKENNLLPQQYIYHTETKPFTFQLHSSDIDDSIQTLIRDEVKNLDLNTTEITSEFRKHKSRVLKDLDELTNEIDGIHGNISSWLSYVALAVVTVLSILALFLFCKSSGSVGYNYVMLFLLLLPLIAAKPLIDDDKFPGNCTASADIQSCTSRDFDACYLLENESYCFCDNTQKYSSTIGRLKCNKPHPIIKSILDFFRNIFEISHLNLVLTVIVILLLLWPTFKNSARKYTRIPFRKQQ